MNYKGVKRENLIYILEQVYQDILAKKDENTAIGVILHNKEDTTIEFKYFIENNKWQDEFTVTLDEKEGLVKRCIDTRETLILDDYYNEWVKYVKNPSFDGEAMRSIYMTPIIIEGEVKGVFTIQNKSVGLFKGGLLNKINIIKKVLESFFYEDMEKQLLEDSKKEVERLLKQLSIVKEVGQLVVSASDLKKISQSVYETIKKNYNDCAIGISINDPEGKKLKNTFLYELGELIEITDTDYSNKKSVMVKTVLTKKEIILEGTIKDEVLVLEGEIPKAVYSAPLKMKDKIIGCFTYQIFHSNYFKEEELEFCRQITPFMTIAVNNFIEKNKILESNRILKSFSERDNLTGLYNRRYFYEIFDKGYKEIEEKKKQVYLIILDLDNFKGINDNFGHSRGDEILQKISSILKKEIPNEYVGRYGGDEFIAGTINRSKDEVLKIGERIRKKVEELRIYVDKEEQQLTISIGILKIAPEKTLRESFSIADELLYTAKNKGKNIVVFK